MTSLARRLLTTKADLRAAIAAQDPLLTVAAQDLAGFYQPRAVPIELLGKWGRSLDVSENLAVTSDIGALLTAAADDLPDDLIPRHEHLFTEHAFVLFETPLHDEVLGWPINALSWHAGTGLDRTIGRSAGGLEVNLWTFASNVTVVLEPGVPRPLTPLVPCGSDFMPWGRPPTGWDPDHTPADFVSDRKISVASRVVLTLQAFLRDELPAVSHVPTPRSMARRFRREGWPDPGVTIIDLRRRAPGPREEAPADSGRRLTYRHVVRGHWHGYWVGPGHRLHPGGTEDKVLVHVYLAPYLKGPDDAPIRPTEIVNLARR